MEIHDINVHPYSGVVENFLVYVSILPGGGMALWSYAIDIGGVGCVPK